MNADNIVITEHEVHNYVVYQTYAVEAAYQLRIPIKYLFSDDYLTIDMTAREEVPITDTSEFIRNVDMAVDLTERTKTGSEFLEKSQDLYTKVDKFINGKSDGGGAESGGAPSGGNKLTSAAEYAEKVSDKTMVNGTYPPYATASDILRGELYDAGISNPPYSNAAHHIVPWNDNRAKDARKILDKYGIEYNSAANGVFLPYEKTYTGDTTIHNGNHSSNYIDNITQRLKDADERGSKEGVIAELNKIRGELLDGTLKLNERKDKNDENMETGNTWKTEQNISVCKSG